jgi:hypothetical protein
MRISNAKFEKDAKFPNLVSFSLLSRHPTTNLLNFELGWVVGDKERVVGDEGCVGGFVTNSIEEKTSGFGIRRVKVVAVRQG